MSHMDRINILTLLNELLVRQGKPVPSTEDALLTEVGFRSLDFSELALRVELAAGRTLTFDAAPLRAIRTVKDVVDFFENASRRP
jgi:acyl carrier protein